MSGQYQIGKGDEYGGGSGGGQEIGVEDIEDVSKHFPPCMRYIKMQLDEHSHLRHFARLQYGLFLKGIGLKLPEALAYWKQKFGRKVTADKFDKEYAYNIRHSYGVEADQWETGIATAVRSKRLRKKSSRCIYQPLAPATTRFCGWPRQTIIRSRVLGSLRPRHTLNLRALPIQTSISILVAETVLVQIDALHCH
ncbi:putative DNA primase large subunit [Zancudomyces culisetae]|uniref:Putative DNA primase large subunit n=1 Tax=Zancudomyces culisetae TaxID=1213189 RepID=A0A1R1PVH9_ZANCU|nr:putative DNA primase large subunit [Zancudomyces culisetae]|eukprot:OMH84944.1 putative DNA primase large subunit [Zancudomyces culisetae]